MRPFPRWANVAFVWLLPHQLGFFYGDGRLSKMSRRGYAVMALAGIGTLILITNPIFGEAGREWFPGIGHYQRSLLGVDVEPITNTYPPTIALVAMAFWSIGVAMLLRPALSRWLQRPRPWKAVIFTKQHHHDALPVAPDRVPDRGPGAVAVGLRPAGKPHDGLWAERPLWVGVSGAFLVGLVMVFGRFERPARAGSEARGGRGRSRTS